MPLANIAARQHVVGDLFSRERNMTEGRLARMAAWVGLVRRPRSRLANECVLMAGQSKAQRFPRATVEALQDRQTRGKCVHTTNYLYHLKSLCNWLVKAGRVAANPLVRLEGGDVKLARWHDCRDLEAGELRQLLMQSCSAGGRAVHFPGGPSRQS
jgi:hypothetical protein